MSKFKSRNYSILKSTIFVYEWSVIQSNKRLRTILDLFYSSSYEIRLHNQTISKNNVKNSIQDPETSFYNQAIYPSKFLKTKSLNKTSPISLPLVKTRSACKRQTS